MSNGLSATIKNLQRSAEGDLIPAQEVLDAARALIDVPWKHQGRNPSDGLDCLGLLVAVARKLGLTVKDWTSYGDTHNWPLLHSLMQETCHRVNPKINIRLADIVVFEWERPFHGPPQFHGAFIGDKGSPWSLIHAWKEAEKVVENIFDQRFISRWSFTYRLKGVAA